MTTPSNTLAVAKSQLGTTEHPANSNKQPYGQWYGEDGVSWCSIGVDWVWVHSGGDDFRHSIAANYASCNTARNGWAKWEALHAKTLAIPGDIAYFHFAGEHAGANHTGWVVERTSSGFVTIEFNTSSGSDTNGGAVMQRFRPWSLILDVARPGYTNALPPPLAPAPQPQPAPQAQQTLNVLAALIFGTKIEGAKRPYQLGDGKANGRDTGVKVVQGGLNNAHMPGIVLELDGEYGPHTRDVVEWYQATHHMHPDGIAGPATLAMLFP